MSEYQLTNSFYSTSDLKNSDFIDNFSKDFLENPIVIFIIGVLFIVGMLVYAHYYWQYQKESAELVTGKK